MKKQRNGAGESLTIGLAIREYLISHGISQAFVARKCGWSEQRINAIVTGKQKIRGEEIKAVCDALGLPYDYCYNAAKTAQGPT